MYMYVTYYCCHGYNYIIIVRYVVINNTIKFKIPLTIQILFYMSGEGLESDICSDYLISIL